MGMLYILIFLYILDDSKIFQDEKWDLIEQLWIDSDIVTYIVWFPR